MLERGRKSNKKSYQKHKHKRLRPRKCRYCDLKISEGVSGKFCNTECLQLFVENEAKFTKYKDMCRFVFNIKKFPDEFDFELINKHGLYSPSNKGNNLKGVSRDHMLSVKYGFDNKINPYVVSHPANCQLMLQDENRSKSYRCSLTLGELRSRIKKWNKKYPLGPNGIDGDTNLLVHAEGSLYVPRKNS